MSTRYVRKESTYDGCLFIGMVIIFALVLTVRIILGGTM